MTPMEKRRVIMDEPPTERKGRGIPVTGKIPTFMPILTNICIQICMAMPNVNRNKTRLFLERKALVKRVLMRK